MVDTVRSTHPRRQALRGSGKGTRGVTLVEVMLAAFIVGLTAVLAAASMPISHVSRARASLQSRASALAHKELEAIRSQGYAGVTATQLNTVGLIDSTTPVSGTTYSFNNADSAFPDNPSSVLPSGGGTVTITEATTGLREVIVTVTWTDTGNARSYSTGTVVANL